jgi:hypothetical protein
LNAPDGSFVVYRLLCAGSYERSEMHARVATFEGEDRGAEYEQQIETIRSEVESVPPAEPVYESHLLANETLARG